MAPVGLKTYQGSRDDPGPEGGVPEPTEPETFKSL